MNYRYNNQSNEEGGAEMTASEEPLVAFTLDGQHYALRLASVERLVRMVEVIPLPKAPSIVMGVINVQGRIIPVLNLRKRLRLREQEPELSHQIIVARSSARSVGLAVDSVTGVVEQTPGGVTP